MSYFENFLKANQAYVELHGELHLPIKPKDKGCNRNLYGFASTRCASSGVSSGRCPYLRNAGGRVTEDMIRSLVISQQQMGTREIVVLHHTDCGAQTFNNEDFQEHLKCELGVDVSGQDFLPFQDIDESVREDMKLLRECPLIPDDVIISGAVYDVDTGSMREIY